ncbi:MAG: hypothetical protein K8E66_14140, partial [Phycisphaerales bacterium]|nr:hypothetical protein [Phycisphaerales bacterium]
GGEPGNDVFPGDAVLGDDGGVIISADLEDRGCDPYGGGYDCGPDTTLGIFGDFGDLLFVDDDGSFLGNGLASAVFQQDVEANGLIDWAVSGYDDFDFDGFSDFDPGFPHGQFGEWEGYIDYYDKNGDLIHGEWIGAEEFIAGDEVFTGIEVAPEGAFFYDLYLDNSIGSCECFSDIDYYCVGGLEPDTEYEIRVTSADFDTILGLLDGTGTLIDSNDDDPDAGCCLSVLNGFSDGQGDLYFVITGCCDDDFTGMHTAFGDYEIAVTPAVGPCNAADLAEPYGLLDLADINTFVTAFLANDPVVDFDGNGLYDLADINTFVSAFMSGCP